ncbi:MAG: NADH-quinone oxidoreductase subunit J [Candidatus Thorarchaeota archaeon]
MQDFLVMLEQLEFVTLVIALLLFAYLALEHREIIYAAFFFMLMTVVVAGLFLLLDAPFLVAVQLVVYTGSISVIIVFAVLLLPRSHDVSLEIVESSSRKAVGIILAVCVITLSGSLALLFSRWQFMPLQNPDLSQSLQLLSQWIWGGHGIYVILVGLIMMTTVIGAVVIMQMEKETRLRVVGGGEQPADEVEEVEDHQ